MRRFLYRAGPALVALSLIAAGCGDDSGSSAADSSSVTDTSSEPTVPDDRCSPEHPVRASREAQGYVVACLSEDMTSVHVTNVSAHVLVVRPTASISTIVPASIASDVGVQAARGVTGFGWSADRTSFILPLGGSLVASGNGPAVVIVEPDVVLTAQANSARYVADWMVSRVRSRGLALVRRIQSCVQTAEAFAQENRYLADVMRNTLDTAQCANSLVAAIRESGGEPSLELPRARTAILRVAEPVATDRLISFTARVFAR